MPMPCIGRTGSRNDMVSAMLAGCPRSDTAQVAAAGVPTDGEFATKPGLALEMIINVAYCWEALTAALHA
jgi:hypothetical protein